MLKKTKKPPTDEVKVKHHHLDRRAHTLLAADGNETKPADDNGDDLLNTTAVAEWLGVSSQWLEIGRHRGYGPKYVRLGPNAIRYRRADIVKWLHSRIHARTSEYTEQEEA